MRTPDEILAYCEKATAGPWRVDVETIEPEEISSIVATGSNYPILIDGKPDDCAFVAAARVDLPRMAKRVKELEAALRWVAQQFCDRSSDGTHRCAETLGLCITEWCLPCYAEKALEDHDEQS